MERAHADRYENLFTALRTRITSDTFVARHRRRPTDFTRQRQLTFPVMLMLLINMLKRALQDELDEFFRLFQDTDVADRVVTKSAFSQARQKVKYTAFMELNDLQVTAFYTDFDIHRWHGYRLLAIDGSMVDVPNTLANQATFGTWGSRYDTHTAKARVSQLFDVLNDVTIAGTLAPKTVGERALAHGHLDQVGAGDLLLLDRGYPAFWLFLAMRARGADYCARLDIGNWRAAQEMRASGVRDQMVTVPLCHSSKTLCRHHGFSCETVTLRLVRVDLPNGEVEILATSLVDSDRFPPSVLAQLYQQRWPVEEDYKRCKARLELENWSGTSTLAVYQDFYATLFTKNLAAILAHPAQQAVANQTADRRHPYQVNMTNLLSKLKDTVVLLCTRLRLHPLLQALWRQMTQTVEPVRPNRSVPRKTTVRRRKYPRTYKPTR